MAGEKHVARRHIHTHTDIHLCTRTTQSVAIFKKDMLSFLSSLRHRHPFLFLLLLQKAYWPVHGHWWMFMKVCVLLRYTVQSLESPRAHLHVVGDVAVYVFDVNQPSLPTPFHSVLVSISVFMAFSTVFHSINSPDNSPLSYFVPPGLISALLVLSIIYLFMKISFSPDIFLCGWLGLRHQLTN